MIINLPLFLKHLKMKLRSNIENGIQIIFFFRVLFIFNFIVFLCAENVKIHQLYNKYI